MKYMKYYRLKRIYRIFEYSFEMIERTFVRLQTNIRLEKNVRFETNICLLLMCNNMILYILEGSKIYIPT